MDRYRLMTGNQGFYEWLLQHPVSGPNWEAPCDYDEGLDQSSVQIYTPDGETLPGGLIKLAQDTIMQVKTKIGLDLIKRRQKAAPPATPAAPAPDVPAPQHNRRQFTATTGDEAVASAFKTIQTERWILDVSHLKSGDKVHIQLIEGHLKVIGRLPIDPKGSLKQRLTDALNEHCDGKTAPAPISTRPLAPEAAQPKPVDQAARPADMNVRYLALDEILTGDNVREDMGDLEEFAADISRRGIKQPLTVRPAGDEFRLVAGERRLRAARIAGLRWVPCLVDGDTEEAATEWMLSENEHRKDLSPIEKARGYQRLLARYGDQGRVAVAVNKGRQFVNEHLQLLELPPDMQHQVATGALAVRVALDFLRRTRDVGQETRQQVAAAILQAAPSARQANDVIDRELTRAGVARATSPAKGNQNGPADPTRQQPGPGQPVQPAAPPPAPTPQPPPTQPPTQAPTNEAVRSARLAEIGRGLWAKRLGNTEVAHHPVIRTRECYVSITAMQASWARRGEVGASTMPGSMGRTTIDIPEQRVWISGGVVPGGTCAVEIWDDEYAITTEYGGLRGGYDGQPVYYRIELLDVGPATVGILQQFVLEENGRHVVVSGVGSAEIDRNRVPTWTAQLDELPGMPAA